MSSNEFIAETQKRLEALIEADVGVKLGRGTRTRMTRLLREACVRLDNPTRPDQFASREATILLADLRGFSSLSEALPITAILDVLNGYLGAMSETILREGGAIDKFMGDSVMAVFSGPDTGEAARNAMRCAVRMQISMDDLNQRYRKRGLPDLFMGIGINTGTVMAGKVGSDLYSEYTVIGDDVNLVSRIESFSLRGQILVSERTFHLAGPFAKAEEPIEVQVKGRTEPVFLREILGIPSLRLKVPRREVRRSVRVRADLPVRYRQVVDKIVENRSRRGRLVDISYHGMQAELPEAIENHTELKLSLDLPLVGYRASDLYVRVLRVQPAGSRWLASLEISSSSIQTLAHIRRFVQLLLQGSERA